MRYVWNYIGKKGREWKAGVIAVLMLVFTAPGQLEGAVSVASAEKGASAALELKEVPSRPSPHPLLSYSFTNELGRAMTLGQFRGQALAVTFFFTRCSNPDYCPRLSKNFQEAIRRLLARPGSPTNWHFVSVTIDPKFDTPAVLKAYGGLYGYDPAHWSFITGPKAKIEELARLSDAQYAPESGTISHNFRTLVIDTRGDLQMAFPTSGDFSASLAEEVIKAALVKPEAR